MSLRNQPYLPLYVQDYLTDERLSMCRWETQGIYIKILCILHKQEEYGCILFKQNPKQEVSKGSNSSLDFASILVKLIPCQLEEMVMALDDLIEHGVLIIEEDKMYQKRMVKDNAISEARSKAGKKGGGNPNLFKQNSKQQFKQKDKQNPEYEYEYENENENKDSVLKNGEFDFFILTKNRQWIESIFSQVVTSKGKNVSFERFTNLLNDFCTEKSLSGEIPKNEPDYRRHFINWIKIQVDKPNTQSNGRDHLPAHLRKLVL